MAGVGDVVRSMDYQKRARKTLGVKTASRPTKLQECSPFVKSVNEHHVDKLHNAMRKMEADEKLFRDVHNKEMSSVKRFHNTVHARSTSFNDFDLNSPSTSIADSRSEQLKRVSNMFVRRSSFPAATSPVSDQKRRHTVQVDTSKYGRSFRKLRDAITPKPKSRVSPEPVPQPAGPKPISQDPCVLLVAEAHGAVRDRS